MSSKAQQKFMEQEQLHTRNVKIIRVLVLALFLIIWELCARWNIIDDFIFSSPTRVVTCFWGMVQNGSIFIHVGITLLETMISFFLVVIAGLGIAIILWLNRSISEVLEPYFVMLNSLPKSALAPMLIVWFGSHIHTIVITAISVTVFGSILTLYNGFSNIDEDKIKLIYSLGGTRKHVLTKVLLPGSVPLIISNMKVNVGLCLVGVIIGEFLTAQIGLGYLIIYASQTFKLDIVVMSITILCMMSALLYQGIAWFEKNK